MRGDDAVPDEHHDANERDVRAGKPRSRNDVIPTLALHIGPESVMALRFRPDTNNGTHPGCSGGGMIPLHLRERRPRAEAVHCGGLVESSGNERGLQTSPLRTVLQGRRSWTGARTRRSTARQPLDAWRGCASDRRGMFRSPLSSCEPVECPTGSSLDRFVPETGSQT